jgi:hypothetical protein
MWLLKVTWNWDPTPGLILKPDCILGAINYATPTTKTEFVNQMQQIIFKLPGFEEATFCACSAGNTQLRISNRNIAGMQLSFEFVTFLLLLAERKTTTCATITQLVWALAILKIENLVDISTLSCHSDDLYCLIPGNQFGTLSIFLGSVLEQHAHFPLFAWT